MVNIMRSIRSTLRKIFRRKRGQKKKDTDSKKMTVQVTEDRSPESPDPQPIAVPEDEERQQETTVTTYAEVHQELQNTDATTVVSTPPPSTSSEMNPITALDLELSSSSKSNAAISSVDDSTTKLPPEMSNPTVSSSSGEQLSDQEPHVRTSSSKEEKSFITSEASTCFPNSSSSSCYHSASTDSEEDCGDEIFEGNVHLSFIEWLKDSHQIWGRIKVRNFPGEKKQVFVRWTSDNWSSYTDTHGVTKDSGVENLQSERLCYTYTFEIPVREGAESVELAVAYEVDGKLYWDNNSNKNYNIAVQN